MEHSPAVCLRLITDQTAHHTHHCSLCLFFHDHTTPHTSVACPHRPSLPVARTMTPCSDSSFYTAATSDTDRSDAPTRSGPTPPPSSPLGRGRHAFPPVLRRRASPTATSLREIRAVQAQQGRLRAQVSEEALQRAYEAQILAYLDGAKGGAGELARIVE